MLIELSQSQSQNLLSIINNWWSTTQTEHHVFDPRARSNKHTLASGFHWQVGVARLRDTHAMPMVIKLLASVSIYIAILLDRLQFWKLASNSSGTTTEARYLGPISREFFKLI